MTTTMMTMRRRKRSPMTINRLPARQTTTHRQGGGPAAVGALSRTPPTPSPRDSALPRVRSPVRGEFGPTEGPHLQAAGGLCSPGGAGRRHRGPSPPAVRAAPPAWSCPRPADTSHLPLREDHLPSVPFLLFVPFRPAATGRHMPGPRLHQSGYSTGPLDTYRGRALEIRVVTSKRGEEAQQRGRQKPACFHLPSVTPAVKVILASKQLTTSSATFPCTPNKPSSHIS